MPIHVVAGANQPASGPMSTDGLVIDTGGTLTATADLEIQVTGSVFVMGSLEASPGVNAGIKLVGGDDVHIFGTIRAGNGADATRSTGASTNLNGDAGQPGGSIAIQSVGGDIQVYFGSQVVAGHGGKGADVSASGNANTIVAHSGPGGAGGGVGMEAAHQIRISGQVTGGRGGNSGSADATAPADSILAEAVVQLPGAGGDVDLSVTGPVARRMVVFEMDVQAGDGGSSGKATANGGQRAHAVVKTGGAGGNILIRGTGTEQFWICRLSRVRGMAAALASR